MQWNDFGSWGVLSSKVHRTSKQIINEILFFLILEREKEKERDREREHVSGGEGHRERERERERERGS